MVEGLNLPSSVDFAVARRLQQLLPQLPLRCAATPRRARKRRQMLRSRDRLKKLNWFHLQRVRQCDDVDQPDVAFASLDSTDIVSMQIRQLRQAFLRKAALHPQFANASAE